MAKRVDPDQRRDEQLLVRVTRDELEWLESAAHLERVTANAYVYQLVQRHVQSLKTNDYVRADVENRRAYQAATSETIPIKADEPGMAQRELGEKRG